MADYTAGGKTFRSTTIGGKEFPVVALVEAQRTVLGYGWDDNLSTSQVLPTIPANATHALVTVEGSAGGVRYREDGADVAAVPSSNANSGLFVPVGAAFVVAAPPGGDLDDVRVIETDAGVIINVVYYRVDQ